MADLRGIEHVTIGESLESADRCSGLIQRRNIHIVSMVNAIVIVAFACRALNQPALAADKVYGWHETAEVANAVAVGYVRCSHLQTV